MKAMYKVTEILVDIGARTDIGGVFTNNIKLHVMKYNNHAITIPDRERDGLNYFNTYDESEPAPVENVTKDTKVLTTW